MLGLLGPKSQKMVGWLFLQLRGFTHHQKFFTRSSKEKGNTYQESHGAGWVGSSPVSGCDRGPPYPPFVRHPLLLDGLLRYTDGLLRFGVLANCDQNFG